jgi:hypothetical protein
MERISSLQNAAPKAGCDSSEQCAASQEDHQGFRCGRKLDYEPVSTRSIEAVGGVACKENVLKAWEKGMLLAIHKAECRGNMRRFYPRKRRK